MAIELADAGCKDCHGDGVIYSEGGYAKKCLCVLRNEFFEYVTPYDKATFLKNVSLSKDTKDKDVFLYGTKEQTDSVIKTFLFHVKYTYKVDRFEHETIDPETARMAYLHCVKDTSWQMRLRSIDFLIIKIEFDVFNSFYGDTLMSLIAKRRSADLSTWVVSFRTAKDDYLKKMYTPQFVKYMDKNMKEIKASEIVRSASNGKNI